MKIIEVDGIDVQPYDIDVINIAVAQRYSILVSARNDTSSNFALHADFDTTMFDTVPDTLQPSECAERGLKIMMLRRWVRCDRPDHLRC